MMIVLGSVCKIQCYRKRKYIAKGGGGVWGPCHTFYRYNVQCFDGVPPGPEKIVMNFLLWITLNFTNASLVWCMGVDYELVSLVYTMSHTNSRVWTAVHTFHHKNGRISANNGPIWKIQNLACSGLRLRSIWCHNYGVCDATHAMTPRVTSLT